MGDPIFAAAFAAALSFGCFDRAAAFVRRHDSQVVEDGRGAPAPGIARYLSDDGGEFVLDLEGRQPVIRFSDTPETWVLSRFRGPRGDMIYKNDMGEPVLRATKLGGMTVFTSRRPQGAAAALIGPAMPVRLTPLGPMLLYQRLYQASVRCSRAAQHQVEFDAPDADPGSDALIADTAGVMVDAMIALSGRSGGRAILARLASVAIKPANHIGVVSRAGVVTITINPALGFGGRPSSERILLALHAK